MYLRPSPPRTPAIMSMIPFFTPPDELPSSPFAVAVRIPGGDCLGYVDLPAAWGTLDECAAFIAEHTPPRGTVFEVQDLDTGEAMQLPTITPATIQRAILVQDLV